MTSSTIPADAVLVRTTPWFDQDSVPSGLLEAHRVADGVWGRLVVQAGSLRFAFEDDDGEARTVGTGDHVVIPPGRPHHVELVGSVTFAVEFHREP